MMLEILWLYAITNFWIEFTIGCSWFLRSGRLQVRSFVARVSIGVSRWNQLLQKKVDIEEHAWETICCKRVEVGDHISGTGFQKIRDGRTWASDASCCKRMEIEEHACEISCCRRVEEQLLNMKNCCFLFPVSCMNTAEYFSSFKAPCQWI